MTNKEKQKLEEILAAYIGNDKILENAVEIIGKVLIKTYQQGRKDRNEELKTVLTTKTIIEFSEFIHRKMLKERPAHN